MSEVRVERDGHVATIVLAAPRRRNALTPAMAGDLVFACQAVNADTDIGAVVIRGEGDGFCAGAHRETLANVGADPAKDELYKQFTAVYRAFARVARVSSACDGSMSTRQTLAPSRANRSDTAFPVPTPGPPRTGPCDERDLPS
jgi:hypothetical protein